jgi:hypothetical protein
MTNRRDTTQRVILSAQTNAGIEVAQMYHVNDRPARGLPAHLRKEYLLNRGGGTLANRLALRAESWMHRMIAQRALPGAVLEIGGGTLNHLPYEPEVADYDVVEPFEALYSESANRPRVRRIFPNIEEVPKESRYDRIVSIAALEHLEDLPKIIARSALLLSEGGIAQHSIPSEGGMLWGVSWRLTTGLAYRLRNGLSYGVAMRHEHINDAPEIIAVLAWFFERVEIRRYPVPFHHVSLYTYVEATHPRCDRCREYLEGRGTTRRSNADDRQLPH